MIGIIGAMEIEIAGIRDLMTDAEEAVVGGMTFVSGKISGKSVVAAVCGEGKVNSAMCAQTMILTYKPSVVINTGVAGGLAEGLKIADIVIADCVVQHDSDMTPLGYPIGYVCGANCVEFKCDDKINELLAKCVCECGINCKSGVIVSGDSFISSDDKKKWLVKTFNGAACEMEGGAIGQVCMRNGVPFGVMRAISDGGNDEANISFSEFAEIAAANTIKVMERFMEKV